MLLINCANLQVALECVVLITLFHVLRTEIIPCLQTI